MEKILKAPAGLTAPPYNQSCINLKGVTVVESCTHVAGKTGSMFLEDHILLCVLQGSYTIRYGKQSYTVQEQEMVLLKKSIVVEYSKSGNPENDNLFEYMLFFLKDDFLQEFIQMANITPARPEELVPISVKNIDARVSGFIQSLKPYFNEQEVIEPGLIKLKMLELLYAIAQNDKNLLQQLLQLKQQVRSDISEILEKNYMHPVGLGDLAYLSGRSLSSFKRDFKAIYNIPPSQWLKERRLAKAKELLSNTEFSVTDVGYTSGFENVTHFSRVFKERYGASPSSYRRNLHSN